MLRLPLQMVADKHYCIKHHLVPVLSGVCEYKKICVKIYCNPFYLCVDVEHIRLIRSKTKQAVLPQIHSR